MTALTKIGLGVMAGIVVGVAADRAFVQITSHHGSTPQGADSPDVTTADPAPTASAAAAGAAELAPGDISGKLPAAVAATLVSRYDRSGDGNVDYLGDEASRVTGKTITIPADEFDAAVTYPETFYESGLFHQADARGNGDGTASTGEVTSYLASLTGSADKPFTIDQAQQFQPWDNMDNSTVPTPYLGETSNNKRFGAETWKNGRMPAS